MHSTTRTWLVRSIALIALGFALYYLTWRAVNTFNPHAFWLSLLLFGAEVYGLLMFALHIFLTWDTRSLERRLGLGPGQRLEDAALTTLEGATVDVFIPTYNESVSLLRKSVLAAREIRGEHLTWVLDDGRRDEVRQMCEELEVGYLTRDSNDHAKAGNINAALGRTSGELIVVLDADFIALPQLLERTLGHFRDDRLAFVQLPQAFYNVDSIQHVGGDLRTGWHEQTLFYDAIQPGKNRWNSAFWCGSPAVVRRTALESVGGAATSTVTEDILTSMRLHASGWRSLYHNETLAVGIAPGDLDGFRTQRLRWAQGSMQILRTRENPLWKPGLTIAQRVNYFASMTTYFQALQLAVLIAMPLLVLISDQSPIAGLGSGFFIRFVPYLALTIVASKLLGQGRQRFLWDQYYSFLRLFTFLRALPVLVFGGKGLRFRVTPKTPTATTRHSMLYPHVAVGLLNLGVIITLLATPLDRHLSTATVVIVAVSAGIVAATYLSVVLRLWRRVYRRHHYRFSLELPALYCAGGDERELPTSTEDISFGGASILLPEAVDVGGKASLPGIRSDAVIKLDGTVVSCRPHGTGYRVALEFGAISLDDEALLLLRLLEAALGEQTPADQPSPVPLAQWAQVTA